MRQAFGITAIVLLMMIATIFAVLTIGCGPTHSAISPLVDRPTSQNQITGYANFDAPNHATMTNTTGGTHSFTFIAWDATDIINQIDIGARQTASNVAPGTRVEFGVGFYRDPCKTWQPDVYMDVPPIPANEHYTINEVRNYQYATPGRLWLKDSGCGHTPPPHLNLCPESLTAIGEIIRSGETGFLTLTSLMDSLEVYLVSWGVPRPFLFDYFLNLYVTPFPQTQIHLLPFTLYKGTQTLQIPLSSPNLWKAWQVEGGCGDGSDVPFVLTGTGQFIYFRGGWGNWHD